MTSTAMHGSYTVGRATVTKIPEIEASFPAAKLLPGYDEESASTGGDLILSVHSWLIRIDGLTVLVDAGIGNGKPRASKLFDRLNTRWLDRMVDAGVRPQDVTHVLLTHLHTDHVGWNTVLSGKAWTPTFPNARTLLPRRGYDRFSAPDGRQRPNFDMFADSVLPVIEAGRTELVSPDGGEVLPGFTYLPTPGHSPDHMSILLRSDGEEALFAGDLFHHPVQVTRPALCSTFCEDHDEARRSRTRMLDLAVERRLLWFSSHCTETSVGTVERMDEGLRWAFAPAA